MNHLLKIFILVALGLLVTSCEKDEDQAVLNQLTTGTLSADKNTVVLNEITADNPSVNFTWTMPTFNIAVIPGQQIEFDLKGNSFKNSKVFDVANDVTSGPITHATLNSIMYEIGATPDEINQVEVRMKTNVGSENFYSNIIEITVTPYTPNPDLVFPKINVPGGYAGAAGYQEWTPGNSPNLFSPEKDNKYRGFIYVTNPNSEYKFTINQDWAGDKGDDGTFTGKLVETGEQNIKAAAAGTYYLKVDWNANTYSAAIANFGVIGDATPTGWSSDTDFTYNPTTKTYVINSIALSASGIFKFRANDDWAMKFQPDANDQTIASGAAIQTYLSSEGTVTGDPNYKVSQSGNYKIELDVHNSAYYKLTLTKL